MNTTISKRKIKNFRRKIKEITDQEAELRLRVRSLYDQFVLDVGDSELALRHVRHAFFQIQKYRHREKLAELMEFHPFFHRNLSNYIDASQEDEDEII